MGANGGDLILLITCSEVVHALADALVHALADALVQALVDALVDALDSTTGQATINHGEDAGSEREGRSGKHLIS